MSLVCNFSESKVDAGTSSPSMATTISSPNRREQAEDLVSSSSGGNGSDVAVFESGNKAAWARTSNGPVDSAPVVLGEPSSWPALSESTKVSMKPSLDGSASALVINRGDDVGTSGKFSTTGEPSSSSLTSSSAEISQSIADKESDKGNSSNWDHRYRDPRGWVDQGDRRRRHGGNSRRGGYGSRRDEDRVVRDWYRPPNVRDSYMQRSHPGLPVMQPHRPAMLPFFSPAPFYQQFLGPMAYPDVTRQLYFFPSYPNPENFGGYPFVPPPAPPAIQEPMFFPSAEQKRFLILKQIEYYFSLENLCGDVYLRSIMDSQGWVQIREIANFKRIKMLTDSIPFILDAIRPSDALEVEGNRVRKRDGWQTWVLEQPQNEKNNTEHSEPNSETASNHEEDSVTTQIQAIALGEGDDAQSIERSLKQFAGDLPLSNSVGV